jgi:hypothetical protein
MTGHIMKINETTYRQLPDNLQALFCKCPNLGSEEVVGLFPEIGISGDPRKADGSRSQEVGHHGWDRPWKHRKQRQEQTEPYNGKSGKKLPLFDESRPELHNDHPTVKPLALMEYLARLTNTPTGGVIVDPFCGSGTILIAAGRQGRRAIGIEIEERYCEIAANRLRQEVFEFGEVT